MKNYEKIRGTKEKHNEYYRVGGSQVCIGDIVDDAEQQSNQQSNEGTSIKDSEKSIKGN